VFGKPVIFFVDILKTWSLFASDQIYFNLLKITKIALKSLIH